MRATPRMTVCWKRHGGRADKGFSLIELLTVICIIGIMAAAASSALTGVLGTRGVAGAVNMASSLAMNARMEAMSRAKSSVGGARIVVDSTPDTNDTSLRRMVVVRNVSTSSTPQWEMAGAPITLPRGVFFSSNYSQGTGNMTDFKFPRQAAAKTCVYYEFDERGRFVTPATGEAQLVFVSGVLDSTGNLQQPLSEKHKASRDGIILRRAGRVTYFQNPDQITNQ